MDKDLYKIVGNLDARMHSAETAIGDFPTREEFNALTEMLKKFIATQEVHSAQLGKFNTYIDRSKTIAVMFLIIGALGQQVVEYIGKVAASVYQIIH